MMRVGIDLSITQVNQAGTAVYAANLIESMQALEAAPDLTIFKVKRARNMEAPKTLWSRGDTLYRDLLWNHVVLPRRARESRVDILHMPANFAPLKAPCPTVVTIHDTAVMDRPGEFTWWLRNFARFALPLAAKKAHRVLTVSEASKRDIVRVLRIPPEKVTVTYNGICGEFRRLPPEELLRTRRLYALNRYILSVGTLEPRKNMLRLLRAFARLRTTMAVPDIELIHVGPKGWAYQQIFEEVTRLGIRNSVRFLGVVPREDLVGIYNGAEVFVYPSLYEGFGLPVLEAMSCGCPVIASNISAIPEVTGETAVLIDPLSESEIFTAMRLISQDHFKAEQMRQAGLVRAQLFSWKRCARETLRAYEEVLQG